MPLSTSKTIALAALAISTMLGSCSKAPKAEESKIALPKDMKEQAATCYAATITAVMTGETPTAEQANQAAQYLYLGIINDGLAEASALPALVQKGEAMRPAIEKAGDAKDYIAPCQKAFPSTAPGLFTDIPADDRDTRMMCFTLSTGALQMYQSSSVPIPAEIAKMNEKLDAGLRDEINEAGGFNPAELGGFALRAMAKSVELGPMNDVLKACSARYNKP